MGMNNTNTINAAKTNGLTYFVARKIKGKWHVGYRLVMPANVGQARAAQMANAANPEISAQHGWGILTASHLSQKNVLPFGDVPVIAYDARTYWTHRLTQCHPDSREMFAEMAAAEGVTL